MVAAAIVGGAVIGAGASAYSGNKAAGAQKDASKSSNATQLEMYNQTRADQAPWRVEGGQAVSALGQFLGLGGVDAQGKPTQGSPQDYNKILAGLPGYQFQMDQGNQAVQRNLAARGLLNSGAAGKALQQYGQGVASDYAQQYVGGLESLAGLGQSSTQATGAAGANAANQIGANNAYGANAQASGYVGQANAINAGLSGLTSAYGYYRGNQPLTNVAPAYSGSNALQYQLLTGP